MESWHPNRTARNMIGLIPANYQLNVWELLLAVTNQPPLRKLIVVPNGYIVIGTLSIAIFLISSALVVGNVVRVLACQEPMPWSNSTTYLSPLANTMVNRL